MTWTTAEMTWTVEAEIEDEREGEFEMTNQSNRTENDEKIDLWAKEEEIKGIKGMNSMTGSYIMQPQK